MSVPLPNLVFQIQVFEWDTDVIEDAELLAHVLENAGLATTIALVQELEKFCNLPHTVLVCSYPSLSKISASLNDSHLLNSPKVLLVRVPATQATRSEAIGAIGGKRERLVLPYSSPEALLHCVPKLLDQIPAADSSARALLSIRGPGHAELYACFVGAVWLVSWLLMPRWESGPELIIWLVWQCVLSFLMLYAYTVGISFALLRWSMRPRWVGLAGLPLANRKFVASLCMRHKLRIPKIGIIDEFTPNAATFGWTFNPHIVVTSGLFDSISQDEVNAVLAHEIGHIAHWDFAVATALLMMPLIIQLLSRAAWRASRSDKLAPLVVVAVFLWALKHCFLLFIGARGRNRELRADEFSACVHGSPNALSNALLKITYLMGTQEERYRTASSQTKGKERKTFQRKERTLATLGLMGIAKGAVPLSIGSPVPAGPVLAGELRWQLNNPWAKWYDLFSTHPRTAVRIQELNRICARSGEACAYVVERDSGIHVPFLREWLVWVGLYVGLALLPLLPIVAPIPLGLRLWRRYPRRLNVRSVPELVSDTTASEVRAVRTRLECTLLKVGRSFFLDDGGGILPVMIPWWCLVFRSRIASLVANGSAVVEGWYRHGPAPYFEILRISSQNGTTSCAALRVKVFGLIMLMLYGLTIIVHGMF